MSDPSGDPGGLNYTDPIFTEHAGARVDPVDLTADDLPVESDDADYTETMRDFHGGRWVDG